LAVKPKKLAPWTQIEPPCADCVEMQRKTQGQTLYCEHHQKLAELNVKGRIHRYTAPLNSKWTFGL